MFGSRKAKGPPETSYERKNEGGVDLFRAEKVGVEAGRVSELKKL